jgi:hypothetical protein
MKDFEHFILQTILEKFLGHALMKDVMPEYLNDLQSIKLHQMVLNNMKSGIASHLMGAR